MNLNEQEKESNVLLAEFNLLCTNFIDKFKPNADGTMSIDAFIAININIGIFLANFVLDFHTPDFVNEKALSLHIDQLCSDAKRLILSELASRAKKGMN